MMLDLDDMRRRYRELSSVEDSKENIIEVGPNLYPIHRPC